MVLQNVSMQMVKFMKDIFSMIKKMDKENLFSQMEMYMKDNLWMINSMETENIYGLMAYILKDNGKMVRVNDLYFKLYLNLSNSHF